MKEMTITKFSQQLSSAEPTPGGGAAAGVAGALGVSTIMMAIRFSTSSKKITAADIAMLEDQIIELENYRVEMLELIDADATGFEPLAAAFGMPKNTDLEKTARAEALASGYIKALEAPRRLLMIASEVVDRISTLLPYIKKSIISDIGVGSQLLNSAAKSSVLNVYINTESMIDKTEAAKITEESKEKLVNIIADTEKIYKEVQNKIQNY